MSAPALLPHQQRVVAEKAELDERLGKLRTFLETETCANLDDAEIHRLHRQANVMANLSQILGERIAAFTPEKE